MELDPDPEADPDPDPLVRGTDPGIQIRIRSKMSRIPNTCFKKFSRTAEIAMAEYCMLQFILSLINQSSLQYC